MRALDEAVTAPVDPSPRPVPWGMGCEYGGQCPQASSTWPFHSGLPSTGVSATDEGNACTTDSGTRAEATTAPAANPAPPRNARRSSCCDSNDLPLMPACPGSVADPTAETSWCECRF